MDIKVLNLSVRAFNGLRKSGIKTIEQLQTMTDEQLILARNLGVKCVREIKEKLSKYNNSTKELKIFEIGGDIVIAETEEEARKWYIENITEDNIDDDCITELDIDTNGMWYPTEDPEDFGRIGREEGQKNFPTKFGDLMWYEGYLHKFTPYRSVMKLLEPECNIPGIIASKDW